MDLILEYPYQGSATRLPLGAADQLSGPMDLLATPPDGAERRGLVPRPRHLACWLIAMNQQKGHAEDLDHQVEHLRFEFMRAELDIAATFLAFADTTREPEARTRNLQNAWKAHHEVTKLLAKHGFSDEEQAALEERLVALGEQLNARGVLPE